MKALLVTPIFAGQYKVSIFELALTFKVFTCCDGSTGESSARFISSLSFLWPRILKQSDFATERMMHEICCRLADLLAQSFLRLPSFVGTI